MIETERRQSACDRDLEPTYRRFLNDAAPFGPLVQNSAARGTRRALSTACIWRSCADEKIGRPALSTISRHRGCPCSPSKSATIRSPESSAMAISGTGTMRNLRGIGDGGKSECEKQRPRGGVGGEGKAEEAEGRHAKRACAARGKEDTEKRTVLIELERVRVRRGRAHGEREADREQQLPRRGRHARAVGWFCSQELDRCRRRSIGAGYFG